MDRTQSQIHEPNKDVLARSPFDPCGHWDGDLDVRRFGAGEILNGGREGSKPAVVQRAEGAVEP